MQQKIWMILTQELKLFFFANELYKKLQNIENKTQNLLL